MVLHLVTFMIRYNDTIVALIKHKVSENHLRMRISESKGRQSHMYTTFYNGIGLRTVCHSENVETTHYVYDTWKINRDDT